MKQIGSEIFYVSSSLKLGNKIELRLLFFLSTDVNVFSVLILVRVVS